MMVSSSSFCRAPGSQCPGCTAAMWLIVLPLDVPTLTISRLQEILAVRGGATYITLFILEVPTFTTSRLPRDPSSQRWNYVGEKWPMNFA